MGHQQLGAVCDAQRLHQFRPSVLAAAVQLQHGQPSCNMCSCSCHVVLDRQFSPSVDVATAAVCQAAIRVGRARAWGRVLRSGASCCNTVHDSVSNGRHSAIAICRTVKCCTGVLMTWASPTHAGSCSSGFRSSTGAFKTTAQTTAKPKQPNRPTPPSLATAACRYSTVDKTQLSGGLRVTQHTAADAKPTLRPIGRHVSGPLSARGTMSVYTILCRYVPVGLLEEQYIYRLNDRPAPYVGTSPKQPTILSSQLANRTSACQRDWRVWPT